MFKKKLSAVTLARVIAVSSCVSVFAAPEDDNLRMREDLKYAIDIRLSRYNALSVSKYGGYEGLFYSMKKLIGMSIWVQFALDKTSGVPKGKAEVYRNELLTSVQEFNKAFNESNKDVKPIQYEESWIVGGDTLDLSAICKTSADYAKNYLNEIIKTTPDEDELIEENKKVLRYIYDTINSCIDEQRAANSLIPPTMKKNEDGTYTASYGESFDITSACGPLTSIMDDTKLAKLLRKAKELSASELLEAKPEAIDNRLVLLDRFYKDGTYTSTKLLNAYYMMFSASAMYDPFMSYVGDEAFKEGLMYMTGESEKDSDLMQLYSEAKMYKKPLFFREIDKMTGEPKGNASPITFSEFIDKVSGDKSGSLCMQTGLLSKRADDNAYAYFNIDRFKYKADTSIKNTDESNKTESAGSDPSPGGDTGTGGGGNIQLPDGADGGGATAGGGSTATEGGAGGTGSFLDGVPAPNAPSATEGAQPQTDNSGGGDSSVELSNEPSNRIKSLSGGAVDNSAGSNDGIEEQGTATQSSPGTTKSQNSEQSPDDIDWEETLRDRPHNPYDATLTNEDQMTPAMFTWGEYANGKKVHMGTVLMKNILKDIKNIETLKKANHGLFINCFGDIVTEDDLVIVPGAANPAFYNNGAEYYPYTVAFLKHYPGIDPNSTVFKTQNSNQKGKICLTVDDSILDKDSKESQSKDKETKADAEKVKDEEGESYVIDGSKMKANNDYKIYMKEIRSEQDVKMGSSTEVDLGLQGEMAELGDGIDTMIIFKSLKFTGNFAEKLKHGVKDFTDKNIKGTYEAYMIKNLTASVATDSLEILYSSDVENLTARDLGLIAHNYYWGIMDDGSGSLAQPNEKLNIENMAEWVVPEALNGLNNTKVFMKNINETYENIKAGHFEAFKQMIKEFIKDLIGSFGNIRGVVGFQSAYQDRIFGGIMVISKEYGFYILALVVIVMIFKYMSMRATLVQTVGMASVALAATIVYTTIVPIYIPMALNFFNNNLTRDIAYTALGYKAESYGEMFKNKENKDGTVDKMTTSVNLYKLDRTELQTLAKSMDMDVNDLINGSTHAIDKDAGIYVQGNIIKANTDKLFINYPIVGKYASNGAGGLYYETKCNKMISSSLDYYTPWNIVMNNFIQKLNNFSQVYQLERNTLTYGGLTKDSFLVNSYINSMIYLLPNDWETIKEVTEPEMVEKLKEAFPGNQHDFLGLRDLLIEDPPKNATESLWYKTMLHNGFIYTEDEDRSEEEEERLTREINDVISKVNRLTRNFIEHHREDFEGMSDENIIKIISLYATTILAQETGDWGEMLYPMYLNYEELSLDDVLIAAYTNPKDRLESESLNIVDYMSYSSGIAGTMLLGLLIFIGFCFTTLARVLIPLLYLYLGILLLLKLFLGRDPRGAIKGYVKCTLIVFVCYTVSTASYSLTYNLLHGGVKSLIIQILILATLTETIVRLLFAIKGNLGEMGNGHMYKVTPTALRWLNPMVTAAYLKTRFAEFKPKAPKIDPEIARMAGNMAEEFKNAKSVDEIYDSNVILRRKIKAHEKEEHERNETLRKVHKADLDDFRN